jgi:cbb3-type cytochrome oxidase subunit 3
MGTIRGLITLVLMLTIVALTVWLASGRNKHRFDAAARLPLEDDANK